MKRIRNEEDLGDMAFAEIIIVGMMDEVREKGQSKDFLLSLSEMYWFNNGRMMLDRTGRLEKYRKGGYSKCHVTKLEQ